MKKDVHHEWPMASYMEAWKTFRSRSNENEETAAHILDCENWPRHDDLVILDIGCGDGLLLKQLILQCRTAIWEVRLLDPDHDLIQLAKGNLEGLGDVMVTAIDGFAEDHFPGVAIDCHAVLAVHVAYLMPEEAFERMMTSLPQEVPMYVVVDSPGSVFQRLWPVTAPKYAARVANVHGLMQRLSNAGFSVRCTTVTSQTEFPLSAFERVNEAVISLLCYHNIRDLTAQQRKEVHTVLDRSVIGGRLRCQSSCYEVIRT